MNHYDLAGQLAVITGGAQGIGYAVAARMLASGARVALWDRDAELAGRAALALGPGAFAYGVDVVDTGKNTALYLAVQNRSLPVVELLLAKKANPNLAAQGGTTPLCWAVHGPGRSGSTMRPMSASGRCGGR